MTIALESVDVAPIVEKMVESQFKWRVDRMEGSLIVRCRGRLEKLYKKLLRKI